MYSLRISLLALVLTSSAAHADTFTVTNTDASGAGSLRQAIEEANSTPGEDTIAFDIPGEGPHVIEVTSSLPAITDPVVINATTQPGYSGTPIVEVRAGDTPPQTGLLFFEGSDGSTVTGLAIGGFLTEVRVLDSDDHTFLNTWLGFTAEGTPNGFGFGMTIENSSGTQVGGEAPGEGLALSKGISVSNAPDTEIINLRTGTDPSGTEAAGEGGIGVSNSANVTIRGTEPGRCVIGGSNMHGLRLLTDAEVTVDRCYVGVGSDGTTDIGNGVNGVQVDAGAEGVIVRNSVISANGFDGVQVQGPGPAVSLIDNVIGLTADRSTALPNQRGVSFFGVTGGEIRNNTIAGNGDFNVLFNAGTTGSVVQGNDIGVADVDGDGVPDILHLSEFGQFVIVNGASDNLIGGSEEGQGNVIGVGDDTAGIALAGEETDGNTFDYPTADSLDAPSAAFVAPDPSALSGSIDLCDDGTDTPPTCGSNDNIVPLEIPTVDYHADALDIVLRWFVGAKPDFLNFPYNVNVVFFGGGSNRSGGLVEAFVIGEAEYTEADYNGCGDPPCPKEVTLTPPFPLPPGGFVAAMATDAEGNTSELSAPAAVAVDDEDAPTAAPPFALRGNHPNPFGDRTAIRYTIPEPARVRLAVYDVLGREVAVLVDEVQPAGEREVTFDGTGLPAGLYVYRLEAGAAEATGRMVLTR